MKKIIFIILILSLSACTKKTEYGKCVGLNGTKDPSLNYEYNAWNIGMGVLFCSLVIPPIFVVLDELQCPVSKK